MTKSRLNKTEQKILTLASRSYRGTVATVQREGVVWKDLSAIRSLRVKGLIAQTNSYTEWGLFHGRTMLYFITQDKITDNGRKALETLS